MVSLRSQISTDAPGADDNSVPEKAAAPKGEIHHIEEPRERPVPEFAEPSRRGLGILIFGCVMGAFWAGTATAYLWGYFASQGLSSIDPQVLAFATTVILLPPLLFIAAAFALARALTLSEAARHLALVSSRLTEADEGAVQNAQRLGRAVRRELDTLSAGLDGAFGRFRALETALEERIAQLEDAGARAGVRADTIAQRLHSEREGIEELAGRLDDAAARAAETLAGRTAQLKTMIEDAGGELKAAGQTLDAQVAQFRSAADDAAKAPLAAAIELDRQAKEIENAGEAAAARAEFVLARQDRQRLAMHELLTRLREEADSFNTAIQTQRNSVEMAANVLNGEAQRLDDFTTAGLHRLDKAIAHASTNFADHTKRLDDFTAAGAHRLDEAMVQANATFADHAKRLDDFTAAGAHRLEAVTVQASTTFADHTKHLDDLTAASLHRVDSAMVKANATFVERTERLESTVESAINRLDGTMAQAASRSTQLATSFGSDATRVKDVSDAAAWGIARLVESLREAATSAHALFADSTENAKRRSIDFVGEAMAQCDALLRAAAAVTQETEKARAALSRAAEDAERHILTLPGIAQQEASRVRQMVKSETEAMLDISARAITTLQTRSGRRRLSPEPPAAQPEVEAPPLAETASEGLRGLARRITQPKRRAEDRSPEAPKGRYDLSAVLAAADAGSKPGLRPGAIGALAALQAALADLAGDLEELGGETADPVLWRRYVDGDRAVFARRLAASIGPESVNRITELYRENPRFHDSAETYMAEFEAMLGRAREGDRDGFLASTLLSADTGKIYLAVAYALGRLE